MPWWDKIPLKRNHKLAFSRLRFDPVNPRYSPDKGLPYTTDEEIIRFLYETADLGELLQSISASGYVDIEPLIVCGHEKWLRVLEGNRRLAALKLLTNPELAHKCDINTSSLPSGVEKSLEVTVYRVEERSDARDFIGFKHINGAQRWDSIAKARYAAEWLDEEKRAGESGLSLRQIAKRMGDQHSTLHRMVNGYYVLEQARKQGLFSSEDREQGRQFAFSHLYTALTLSGYRSYLGLSDEARSAEPVPNPIPSNKMENLRSVLIWLYGSASSGTKAVVRSQNPNLRQLGQVLENPKARKIMEQSRDLEKSFAEVDPPQRQFERYLVAAHGAVEDSLKKVSSYTGEDATLLEIAKEISNSSQSLLVVMQKARSEHSSES